MTQYVSPVLFSGVPGNAGAIGHQFRNWLTGYKIAQHYGLTFAHSPFVGSHTQVQIDVPVEQWEPFLNFGDGEVQRKDLKDVEVVKLPRKPWDQARVNHPDIANLIKKHDGKRNVLFECPENQFMPIDWGIFRNNRFRDKYWRAREIYPPCPNLDPDFTTVAVHIRRGDVTPSRYPDRYLSNGFYRKVLDQLVEALHSPNINIFSEGTIEDFQELQDLPCVNFHLGTNVFETFHSMVSADVLLTGIGSFSILAAHLTKGVVVTKPWNLYWRDFPTDNTNIVPITKDGNISFELLDKATLHTELEGD